MKHRKGEAVNGWLIVDKPQGIGSTQVVTLTRRLFNAQKNGHTGTLDPFASGILPIAFGEATKLIDFLDDETKEYEFTVQWGAETDSADSDGTVIAAGARIPADEEIKAVLPLFRGEISQVPPAFCAVKINGQRAYDLARKGEQVEIPERRVTVHQLEFTGSLPGNRSCFKVCCSKGTYVRSLGRDIARKLGSLGYLCRLRRTRSGIFDQSDKILLETLQNVVYVEQRKQFFASVRNLSARHRGYGCFGSGSRQTPSRTGTFAQNARKFIFRRADCCRGLQRKADGVGAG